MEDTIKTTKVADDMNTTIQGIQVQIKGLLERTNTCASEEIEVDNAVILHNTIMKFTDSLEQLFESTDNIKVRESITKLINTLECMYY